MIPVLRDLDVKGKRVLMRVDFNVPLDREGNITDDTRIVAALASIKDVLQRGGSVVLMSHLGRPKGEKKLEYSLRPCAKRLSELLGEEVTFVEDCLEEPREGKVILLENLRFYRAEQHPEEDLSFAKKLAKWGDCYVNDAFGTAHRAHSSIVAVAEQFPSKRAAGFLLEKEVEYLGKVVQNPERPFYALIGGKKISSKIGVLKALIDQVDGLFIGGGMSYTFFKAMGRKVGKSIVEEDQCATALEIIKKCREKGVPLYLPEDVVAADRFAEDAKTVVAEGDIPEGYEGVDIGPKTIDRYVKEIRKAKTVLWNGPFGVFEMKPFAKGTEAIAKMLASLPITSVIGGGDSAAAIKALGLENLVGHVSTGGGASLELVEKGQLPGMQALIS